MLDDMSAGLLTIDDTENFHSGISRYLEHISRLFDTARAPSFVAHFARLALAALPPDNSEEVEAYRNDILSCWFAAELQCSRYTAAYTALTQFSNEKLQERSAIAWADAILGRRSTPRLEATEIIHLLQRLPLDQHCHTTRAVDGHLTTLAQKQASVPGLSSRTLADNNGADYWKILYALRLGRQEYRGAVSVLMKRLNTVKESSHARNDPRAMVLRNTLLAIINTLSCMAPEEAYIVTTIPESAVNTMDFGQDADGRDMQTGWKARTRVIITIEDLRREYQQLLDKCSRIERGDFEFDAGTDEEDNESELEEAALNNGGDAMES